MIDLHTHSTASDGSLSPSELVEYASEKGISVLALTDHDTVLGLEEAAKKAIEKNIIFVPGIEISIEWPTGEFHLLGLGIKTISKSLEALIKEQQINRLNRNKIIIDKMHELSIDVSLEELYSMYHTTNLGRPHLADFLVSKKIVKNRQKAFDLYLGKGRTLYEKKVGSDLETAITAITDSKAIPVLAHPMSLYVSWGKIEDVMIGLKEKGIQGMEAWHPGVKLSEAKRLEDLANRLDFFVTAGSDFHGENVRTDRKIGHTSGMTKIDDRFYYDQLLPHLNN